MAQTAIFWSNYRVMRAKLRAALPEERAQVLGFFDLLRRYGLFAPSLFFVANAYKEITK